MEVKDKIKEIRYKLCLSQVDFSKNLGVDFTTVNRWENGKTRPNFIDLRAINSLCEKNGIKGLNLFEFGGEDGK